MRSTGPILTPRQWKALQLRARGLTQIQVAKRLRTSRENISIIAAHRAEPFDACSYVIDELKKRVPIWKREHTSSGVRWVEGGRPE